jgi:signal recognition particle receptor subunit beta
MQSDEMPRDAVVLILANKQDLPNARPVSAVTEAMKMRELRGRDWYVQAACATNGDGLIDGFEWLAKKVNEKR